MFRRKPKPPKEEKNSTDSDNNVLVRQDPRTRVKTATAQSETTKTTVQSSTIIDHENQRIINSTTHETVTHTQVAGVTERYTRRTPTASELEEMLRNGTSIKTTVTRDNGVHQTAFVQEQRVKLPHAKPSATASTPFAWSKTATATATATATTAKPKPSSTQTTSTSLKPFTRSTPSSSSLRNTFFDTSNLTPLSRNTNTNNSLRSASVKPAASSTTYSSLYGDRFNKTPAPAPTPAPLKWTKSTTPAKLSSSESAKASQSPLNTAAQNSLRNTAIKPYTSVYGDKCNNGWSKSALFAKNNDNSKLNNFFPLRTSYSTPNARGPLASTYKTATPKVLVDAKLANAPSEPLRLTALNPTRSVPRPSARPQLRLEPGHAVIINSVHFPDKTKNRSGSEVDAQRIIRTLNRFRLQVKEHKDLKLKDIEDVVKKLTKKDYTKCACLVIVILSHGSTGDTISAYDGEYNIDKTILQPILNIPSLREKPKIFIIQACKGPITPGDFKTDAAQVYAPPVEVLKCYSTYEGYVSYRTQEGSPFVEALCNELDLNGTHIDLVEIMRTVIEKVKQRTNSKQIPSLTTTLTKPFVFGQYS